MNVSHTRNPTVVFRLMLFVWCSVNSQSWSDHSYPLDSGLSTASRVQQSRTRTAGKANTDNADLQMRSESPPVASALKSAQIQSRPIHLSCPPPTWYLIVNLPVSLIFTFHFPQPADISMVTEVDLHRDWVELRVCISIYVSGCPFMSPSIKAMTIT